MSSVDSDARLKKIDPVMFVLKIGEKVYPKG
jgi:hypothetical protein